MFYSKYVVGNENQTPEQGKHIVQAVEFHSEPVENTRALKDNSLNVAIISYSEITSSYLGLCKNAVVTMYYLLYMNSIH